MRGGVDHQTVNLPGLPEVVALTLTVGALIGRYARAVRRFFARAFRAIELVAHDGNLGRGFGHRARALCAELGARDG